VGTYGRITFTIQVHSRYRARETVRELRKWLESSLEGILLKEGLWETGTGSLDPEIPKIIEVLGGPREESPTGPLCRSLPCACCGGHVETPPVREI
jgi:hypothetical protein